MENVFWQDKSTTFRSLIDNSTIKKPILVKVGSKLVIVGEKFNGQFLVASACKVSNDQFKIMEQEFVLSSKHPSMWKVISKTTSKKQSHIHRLTTKDIETIHEQDIAKRRLVPRSYVCTKDIEVFEVYLRSADSTVVNGHRIERQITYINENTEFQINSIGEVEYTPSEGERTSQDLVTAPRTKATALLQFFKPGVQEKEQLIRNRVVRSLDCTMKNDPRKRSFHIEVNEKPSDIRPIASEGSLELRYLHSTQNLFDYMLQYGNDIHLVVKLVRGTSPIKAIDSDGYIILKTILHGDQIPICFIEDRQVMLVYPDFPIKVKLPMDEYSGHLLPEIRTAEHQCMQLTLALLTRYESEMYVTVEAEKSLTKFLHSTIHQKQRLGVSRQISETHRKDSGDYEKNLDNPLTKSKSQGDMNFEQIKPRNRITDNKRLIVKSKRSESSGEKQIVHLNSSKSNRDHENRLQQSDQHRLEQVEKFKKPVRKTIPEKTTTSSTQNNK